MLKLFIAIKNVGRFQDCDGDGLRVYCGRFTLATSDTLMMVSVVSKPAGGSAE